MALWVTVLPAKASMMVSFLATRPWVFSQFSEDLSEKLSMVVEFRTCNLVNHKGRKNLSSVD